MNHALAHIPEDRIRFHVCWGNTYGPRLAKRRKVGDGDLERVLAAESRKPVSRFAR